MIGVILALLIVPLAAAITAAVLPTRAVRAAAAVTVAAGIACFGLVLALVPAAAHRNLSYSYLRVDAVSAIFLLASGFLYAAVAVYAVCYLKRYEELYARRFYAELTCSPGPCCRAADEQPGAAVDRGGGDHDHLRPAGRDRGSVG